MEEDGLEAVWGREASATAAPAPRPDIGALVSAPAPEDDVGPRRRRGTVLAGSAVAVVVAVVAAVVALTGGDDPDPADAAPTTAGPTSTTAPITAAGPAWTVPVTCPRFEEASGAGRTACPLATDDERAYVLVDASGTHTVRALDAATGQVRWEAPFPEGARTLERLPSVVVVGGVGSRSPADGTPPELGAAVALDPVTGERLWGHDGWLVGPVGRDHLVVDATLPDSDQEVMAVVEAATGREVLRRESDGVPLYLHPCGDDVVLASEGERLTAHDVADGSIHWSVPAPHVNAFWGLHCGGPWIAHVDQGTLVLRDGGTGATIAAGSVLERQDPTGVTAELDDASKVLAVVGDTIVVGSLDGVRGFRADVDLTELWHLPCRECGPDLLVGGSGDGWGYGAEDVVVVLGGEAVVVRSGVAGPPRRRLGLEGGTTKVLAGGHLLAWDGGAVTWSRLPDLDPVLRFEVEGVRAAAAGSSHAVVATRDRVQAYHREDPGG